jgi:hypothetical protein
LEDFNILFAGVSFFANPFVKVEERLWESRIRRNKFVTMKEMNKLEVKALLL